jgi:small subunit ribosomal protein S3Ae
VSSEAVATTEVIAKKKRVKDKWRGKDWYTVMSPSYFGNVELGTLPSDDASKLVGRTVDSTLYEITNDFAHQYLKMYFQITEVEGKTAKTIFRGHEYSRDYLRSLVRRRTTRVDSMLNVTTKDSYKVRVAVAAFTLARIRTSQEHAIRAVIKKIVEEKAKELLFDQFVQEVVLGKIASDIYNEAKKISPLRHIGIRKSKLVIKSTIAA